MGRILNPERANNPLSLVLLENPEYKQGYRLGLGRNS